MTKSLAIKIGLTAIPLVLGAAAVSAARSITAPRHSTQANTITPAPSPVAPVPTNTPKVTVNGRNIPTDAHGNLDLTLPDSGAHIKISNGHTSVSSDNTNTSSSTSVKGGNIDINVHSDSSNGTGRSTLHMDSAETSQNGTTHSSSSTHVFSSGSANVQNQP